MSTRSGPIASKAFLLKEMVVRDVRSRYAGSSLGRALGLRPPGALDAPLHRRVFSLVLRVPVDPGYASFPEFLMAGLLPWMAIQEGIARSASVLVDNAAMVKKTVFPVETLVLSVVLAAVVNELIALAIFARLRRAGRSSVAGVAACSSSRRSLLQIATDLRARLHRGDADRLRARHGARGRHRSDGRLLRDADRVSGLARARAAPSDPRGESRGSPRRPLPPRLHAARSAPSRLVLYLTLFCGARRAARGGPLLAGPAPFRGPHLET